MRSKNILSIAAFIIAFAFSAAFASLFITTPMPATQNYVVTGHGAGRTSCWKNSRSNATAGKIEDFLRRDVSNGNARDRKSYRLGKNFDSPLNASFPRYNAIIEEYAGTMTDLDESQLPQDFQNAWREHVSAWSDYSEFLNNSAKAGATNVEHFDRARNRYDDEISSTWYEVLRVGRAYGADTY